jgi:predicted lipoprotein
MGEAEERKGRNVLLRGVTASVFNILRSFLALFTGRQRRAISRSDAAPVADAAAIPTDTAATATGAVTTTTDVEAAATDAAAVGTVRTGKPHGKKTMSSGFDMQAEIAKLAERIVEPVAVKLTAQDLERVVGQIRDTFEQLNIKRTAADPGFDNMAANILEPVRPSLTDAERRRAVDRLSGAMAAFCQGPGQRAA